MFFLDWQITDDDLLKFKLSQGYGEQKDRLTNNGETESLPSRQRWGEFVATYERNLNEQGAGLYFEAGMNYSTLVDRRVQLSAPETGAHDNRRL